MAAASTEDRFVTIETKIAYQEKLLQDLEEVLLKQARTIEELEQRVRVAERAMEEDKAQNSALPPHEPPPHY